LHLLGVALRVEPRGLVLLRAGMLAFDPHRAQDAHVERVHAAGTPRAYELCYPPMPSTSSAMMICWIWFVPS